ncbi:MAG: phosphatidylglycerophosphatase A [Nitrospirae bacterium]|nr:phosphatidylglycerophosphatase A [Nitrospirota bacterium]MCL5977402.1 phosphatidylglycerophosphatase A [Nitrospirota bacterium]
MKTFLRFLSKIIATVFFIGYIPFAPGTFGSLAALAFIWIFRPDILTLLAILITIFIAGVSSSHAVEKDTGIKDGRYIVIDEFAGYLASVIFLPLTAGYLIAAFFLFRFFDILKPPPIRNVEKTFHGGLGIMFDDLLAGIFTNIILQIWRMI